MRSFSYCLKVTISLVLMTHVIFAQGGGGETTRKPPRKETSPSVFTKKLPPTPVRVIREGDGVIMGTLSYYGPSPPRLRIDTSSDPACNPTPVFVEDLIVTNSRLANVFVYIKTGTNLEGFTYKPPATPVILDQSYCRFVPRVIGLVTNQMLQIWNSDSTSHNVHPKPRNNPEWNQSQQPGATPLNTQFATREVMIPVRDNQHPWKKAFVGVLPHPFFSVSRKDGSFRIEGLPAGRYTVAAWHERLGEQILSDVSIRSGDVKVLTISFPGTQR